LLIFIFIFLQKEGTLPVEHMGVHGLSSFVREHGSQISEWATLNNKPNGAIDTTDV